MSKHNRHTGAPAERIEVAGDTLIIDPLFCDLVLGGAGPPCPYGYIIVGTVERPEVLETFESLLFWRRAAGPC